MGKNMQTIKKKLKRNSLSVKLFLCLFFFGVVVVGSIQLKQMVDLTADLEIDLTESMESDLKQANAFIDNEVAATRNLLQSLSLRNDLFATDDEAQIKKLLSSIKDNTELASTIYVCNENGTVYSNNQAWYDVVQDENLMQHIEKSRQAPEVIRYSEPYYTAMRAKYVVCAALSFNGGKKTVAVEISEDTIYDSLRQILDRQNNGFMLASSSAKIISFSKDSPSVSVVRGTYPIQVADEFSSLAENSYPQYQLLFEDSLPSNRFMMSMENKLNWKVFSFCTDDRLDSEIKTLKNNFILTCIAWTVLLAAVMLAITYFFTKPIRSLADTMNNVNDFEDLVPIDVSREDEIGRLSRKYNRMMERIQSLLTDVQTAEHKKTEYELNMLQNQIGPHFLYNTLACVISLLRQNQTETAQRSLSALVQLLSYSFEKTGQRVTLSDELRQINNYIDIEQMRYGEVFHFETRISPNVSDCTLVKLTLQPLVENAIFHGVIPRGDDDGRIVIKAHRMRNDVIILVCDNGVGMTAERCNEIISGEGKAKIKERLSSIGVSNVQDRLKLTYGSGYGITIRSKPDCGTVIRIKIPLEK